MTLLVSTLRHTSSSRWCWQGQIQGERRRWSRCRQQTRCQCTLCSSPHLKKTLEKSFNSSVYLWQLVRSSASGQSYKGQPSSSSKRCPSWNSIWIQPEGNPAHHNLKSNNQNNNLMVVLIITLICVRQRGCSLTHSARTPPARANQKKSNLRAVFLRLLRSFGRPHIWK